MFFKKNFFSLELEKGAFFATFVATYFIFEKCQNWNWDCYKLKVNAK